jgi:hemerythrin
MEWREEFSVGIPEIDDQHRVLIDCVSLIEDAVTTQQRWSAVHAGLGRLVQFAQVHFAVEESLMRIHHYPGLAKHAEEHRRFSLDMEALQEKSLRVDVSAEMVAFLQGWFDNHIMTSDKQYALYFPQEGVKAAISRSATRAR